MGMGLWWGRLEPLSLEVCLNGPRVIEQSFSGFCLILSKGHNREISFFHKWLLWYLQGLRAHAKNSSIWIVLHIRSLVRALPSTLMSAGLWGHSLYNGRVSHSRQSHFFFFQSRAFYLPLGSKNFSRMVRGFTHTGYKPVTRKHLPFLWDTQSLLWTISSTVASSPSLHSPLMDLQFLTS